jgi:hypothetical protein
MDRSVDAFMGACSRVRRDHRRRDIPRILAELRLMFATITRPRVLSWEPIALVMSAGTAFAAVGSRGGVAQRVVIAGAAVAATAAFLLDDPASETMAASPTPLSARRLQRIGIAVVAVVLWCTLALIVAAARGGESVVRGRALELAALTAVALGVSAASATMGDRTGGGIAGAACCFACFASTFLPPHWWLPFPTDSSAPGAAVRLLAIVACASALLAWTSRDPAVTRRSRRRTGGFINSRRDGR